MKLRHRAGVVLLSLLIASCGKKQAEKMGVKLKGQVLNNDAPITFLKDEVITVALLPPAGSGVKTSGGSTEINPDGTFELIGPKGTGVPAGSYEVRISSSIYGGGGEDRFAKLFSGPKPLTVEIAADDKQSIVVDIGKRTVTKQ